MTNLFFIVVVLGASVHFLRCFRRAGCTTAGRLRPLACVIASANWVSEVTRLRVIVETEILVIQTAGLVTHLHRNANHRN